MISCYPNLKKAVFSLYLSANQKCSRAHLQLAIYRLAGL